jgi:hypothetical protein
MNMDETVTAALSYAARGWSVFPCKPGTKAPLTEHGVKDATTDPEQIRDWWSRWPDANVALACSHETVVAVDVDVDEAKGVNGWESLKEFPELPATVMQKTPRGGAHFLFRADGPVKNKNSFRPGIDIRADGYYVMLPPSVHPNGKRYGWEPGRSPDEIESAMLPAFMRPADPAPRQAGRALLPWEKKLSPPSAPPTRQDGPGRLLVLDRARRYLQECDPAVQGQAGHDKLLWAARAMVVGFDLDDGTALGLLWSDFNPRCVPPWTDAERHDFERKVSEARRTPGSKPRGWLLDEYGLRSESDAMLAFGRRLAESLLGDSTVAGTEAGTARPEILDRRDASLAASAKFSPFPNHCFPPAVAAHVSLVATTHCVDLSFVALPVLVVAGAAVGNAARLRLKEGLLVPPILWGAIVARSGVNKSGPMDDIVEPLREVPVPSGETALLNPQTRMVLGDVTVPVVASRLMENPRGLLVHRNELAAWVKSFDAYKKNGGGGDEQAWIEFWDGKWFSVDRKTNNERFDIAAPAVSVLGSIQPSVLARCFDPSKFQSGFVPRLIVVNPPEVTRRWSEEEIKPKNRKWWAHVVTMLRTRPFKAMKTAGGVLEPTVVTLTDDAKATYVEFYDALCAEMASMDEGMRLFAAKTLVMVSRLALILHGLTMATDEDLDDVWTFDSSSVSQTTMRSAVTIGRWFLGESLRVYGLAADQFVATRAVEILAWLASRGGRATVRDLQRAHPKRYPDAAAAQQDLERLATLGKGVFAGKEFVAT